ncbi:MAG: site-2 protease family protein [Deltaproteobacteria bacterium]|nr:MAG: site-2 protease family protein [Deltaproteobacteria bacterium]
MSSGGFIGNIGPDEIKWLVQVMIVLILSIAVHEFGHAFVADRLGDRLPRSQGRVTLNPVAHADPIGTLLFPVLGFVFSGGHGLGFGWGRPVQVNPVAFTRRFTMRTGHMLVAAAGPAMNIALGLAVGAGYAVLVKTGVLSATSELNVAIQYAVFLNFILAFFNLIPAYPLDGGAVLEGFLPRRALDTWEQIKVYGPFILMAFLFIGPLQRLFVAPAHWCYASYLELWGLRPLFG